MHPYESKYEILQRENEGNDRRNLDGTTKSQHAILKHILHYSTNWLSIYKGMGKDRGLFFCFINGVLFHIVWLLVLCGKGTSKE